MTGLLLGGAVGDALGLPMEGLSRRRAARMFRGPTRQRFLFGRGMCSDDTEHACMTADALLRHPHDADAFARCLAWKLRWWLLAAPAGVGFATLRATLRLWIGIPPARSGVLSAGNGPAMRAPVIGAFFAADEARLRCFVRASTRLTHTDERADRGALVIALAVAHALRTGEAAGVIDGALKECEPDGELHRHLTAAAEHLRIGSTPAAYADAIGLSRGVSGYISHTVPVVLYCRLWSPKSYADAVGACVALGGDTDTTAALVGALAGATCGAAAIPQSWLDGLTEFPRSVGYMRRLATDLARQRRPSSANLRFVSLLLLRNLLFIAVVLAHGVRRLFPPY
jgi:ADP-ribosylglycohydrolase